MQNFDHCRSNDTQLKLAVRVLSYWSLPDEGPKTYLEGRNLCVVLVDMKYTMRQLADFVGEFYMWGSKQYLSLWRDDSTTKDSVEINSDEQLREWFQLNIEEGLVFIIAKVIDFDGPIQFSPTKRRFHPTVRNRLATIERETSKTSTKSPIRERETTKTATKSPTRERERSKTAPKKKVRTTKKKGGDDEEPIGVDDEGIYFETEVLSDSSWDSDLAASSESDDDDYDPDEIVDEDDEDDIPAFSYDVNNPCIDVGVIFPDTKECQSAVTQWCILHDHAYQRVNKDNTRFTAKCKRWEKGCNWKFYACTGKKYIGCKVIQFCLHPFFLHSYTIGCHEFLHSLFVISDYLITG